MECAYSFSFCRLCLRRDDCFMNIFTSNNFYGIVAAKVITEVLHYQVSEEDSYPKVVCTTCLGKLTEFKIFKEQCDKSIATYNMEFCLAEDLRHSQQKEEVPIKDEPPDGGEDGNSVSEAEIDGHYDQKNISSSSRKLSSHPTLCSTSKETDKAERLTIKISRRKAVQMQQKPIVTEESNATSSSVRELEAVMFLGVKAEADPSQHITSHLQSDEDSEGIGGMMMPVETELRSATDVEDEDFLSDDFEEMDDEYDSDYVVGSWTKKGRRGTRKKTCTSSGPDLISTKEDSPFKCEHCGKSFKNNLGLADHKRVHFKDKPYGCKRCEERFATKEEANFHRARSHVQEKNHVCQVCEKRFADEYQLRKHGVVHSEERPFPCEYCGKCFKTKPVLEDHLRIHRNEKPFICKICDKSFNQRANLRAHIASHNNIKPHKCEYCEKTFSRRHHLMDHVRSHTNERPYVCEICGKTFGLRNKWRLHMSSVHATGKDYSCEICGKSFACTKYLKRHSATHNNK